MAQEAEGRVEAIGNFYHRHIYPKITTVTSRLTDYSFPITDLLAPFDLYFPETLILLGVGIGLNFYFFRHSTNYSAEKEIAHYKELLYPLLGVPTIATLTYGLNSLRTPIDKKLGLNFVPVADPEEDLEFVIHQLNARGNIPARDFYDIVPDAHDAVDGFLKKYEGYSVPTTKRVKKSRFSRLELWKDGSMGRIDPFTQEIVVTSEEYPEVIAHEFAHAKGIPQERLAHLVGIASQLDSTDPYLQMLGYFGWLNNIVGQQIDVWAEQSDKQFDIDIALEQLQQRGLNNETILWMNNRNKALEAARGGLMSYSILTNGVTNYIYNRLPEKVQTRIPETLLTFLRNPEQAMTRTLREGLLTVTLQGGIEGAYTTGPVEVLSKYRQKYLKL